MKKAINVIIITLIFAYCHITFGMFLATRTPSLRRIARNTRGFHSNKTNLKKITTQELCKKLIMTLEEHDKIIKELLANEHTSKLTYYPGNAYPVNRLIIIKKMEESYSSFKKLEHETQSSQERD
jgi:hypothetical protein